MYTCLIDESGDVGLDEVQPDPSYGPTQYFCMAAAFFQEKHRQHIEETLRKIPFIKKTIECKKLSHFEKVSLCKTVSTLPVGLLGVISNKLSLLEYLPAAKKTNTHYYNKVTQYLLERIGETVSVFNVDAKNLNIKLEAREQKYDSLLYFIDKIQKNPLDPRSIPIRNINRFSISAVKKHDDFCLGLADIAAHALFCSVSRDKKVLGLSETRYVRELRSIFISDKKGKVVPKGIKLIHSVKDMAIPDDEAEFFNNLTNPQKTYHRL